jgi:3-hydroxybutyryl-CoA dehydrogenase
MNIKEIPVAVVGLGLMGSSIVTCMLIAGHPVVALAPLSNDLLFAKKRITDDLEKSLKHGIEKYTGILSPKPDDHRRLCRPVRV